MRLTPADVHNVAFKKPSIGKRGYDEDEVDAFLDLVETELIRLIEENNELTNRLAAYEPGEHPAATNGGSVLDKPVDGTESVEPVTAEQPQVEAESDVAEQTADEQQVAEQAAADQQAADQQAAEQQAAEQAAAEQQATEQAAPVQPAPSQPQPVSEAPAGAPSTLADHHMHAARLLGLAEETAQRLTTEAQAEAESARNSAREESERLVGNAKNTSEQMLADAKNRSEKMVSDATSQAEATSRDSQLKAEAMDREAQRKYNEVMGRLTEQRTSLEKKIDDLRTYEREYRSRLKGWITEQLHQLDEGSTTTAPDADADSHADSEGDAAVESDTAGNRQ